MNELIPGVPQDKVQQLKAQGYTNSQIIDVLQGDGYTSAQIFDALNQSNVGNAGTQQPPMPPKPQMNPPGNDMPPPPPNDDLPPPPGPQAQPGFTMSLPDEPSPSTPQPQFTQSPPMPKNNPGYGTSASDFSNVSTEEYVEAIIDEKWTELEDDIQKVIEWKNRSEQQMSMLSQQVAEVKERFERLHASLIGKIEDYDKNILEVGAEIKAMEKVFSKVLPAFTDNVKELGEISKQMRRNTR